MPDDLDRSPRVSTETRLHTRIPVDGVWIATAMGARSRCVRRHTRIGLYTDTDVISLMSSGIGVQAVEALPAPVQGCARFSTIHRPNYYFNCIYNMDSRSSGESEKP